MTVDLAALAKLALEATPGPWHVIGTIVCRGIGGIARVENDGTDYSTGEDLPPEMVEWVEQADAAYIAAASPDVVLALVRVALAAKDHGRMFHDCDCTWHVDLRAALEALR